MTVRQVWHVLEQGGLRREREIVLYLAHVLYSHRVDEVIIHLSALIVHEHGVLCTLHIIRLDDTPVLEIAYQYTVVCHFIHGLVRGACLLVQSLWYQMLLDHVGWAEAAILLQKHVLRLARHCKADVLCSTNGIL